MDYPKFMLGDIKIVYFYTMRALFKLFIFAFCFSLINSNAQITLTSSEMPQVDTVYQFHNASVVNVDFSITGADVVWDYTGLTNSGFSADSFANPGITPLVYQLIFNNFLYPSYDATHAQPGSELVLPSTIPFTVTNVYNFYKNSSSSFKMIGFGATINSIPTPIQYQGGDRIYKFPLTYGNIDTSTYSFDVPVPTLGYWKQQGSRYNNVDGFGTLLLPNGVSYDVLRLKSEINIVDSVHVDALGFTIPLPRIRTEYKFVALGEGEPVLQITTQPLLLVFGQETVIGVKYKNEMNLAGIGTTSSTFNISVYPNPSQEQITISNPQQVAWNKLQIYATTGQVVYADITGGNSTIQANLSDLSAGTYYLVLDLLNGGHYTQKLSIQ